MFGGSLDLVVGDLDDDPTPDAASEGTKEPPAEANGSGPKGSNAAAQQQPAFHPARPPLPPKKLAAIVQEAEPSLLQADSEAAGMLNKPSPMAPAPATMAMALATDLDAASEAGTEPAAAVHGLAGDGEPAGLSLSGAGPAAAEHDETQAEGTSIDQGVSMEAQGDDGALPTGFLPVTADEHNVRDPAPAVFSDGQGQEEEVEAHGLQTCAGSESHSGAASEATPTTDLPTQRYEPDVTQDPAQHSTCPAATGAPCAVPAMVAATVPPAVPARALASAPTTAASHVSHGPAAALPEAPVRRPALAAAVPAAPTAPIRAAMSMTQPPVLLHKSASSLGGLAASQPREAAPSLLGFGGLLQRSNALQKAAAPKAPHIPATVPAGKPATAAGLPAFLRPPPAAAAGGLAKAMLQGATKPSLAGIQQSGGQGTPLGRSAANQVPQGTPVGFAANRGPAPQKVLTPAPITPGSGTDAADATAAAAGSGTAAAAVQEQVAMEPDDDLLKVGFNKSFLEGHEQRTLLSSSLLNSMAPAVQEQLHAIDTMAASSERLRRQLSDLQVSACIAATSMSFLDDPIQASKLTILKRKADEAFAARIA
ncbi:hypothetical protein N2152v2_011026 [Parachlorella kessleri]